MNRVRGELRIYLGCAAGVGKTYAMLTEGHNRLSRGTDVIVGYVETHNRPKTQALLDGLEVAPRKSVLHKNKAIEEMDTDYIIRRAPHVVLVDELAHTNADSSVNRKRFEDVRTLLDSGITVIATLNIQHLESVNDVVFDITGIRQSETVPDSFVRSANQIELVDMTPEALRKRIAHGNVYPVERTEVALNNFFKVENLSALRELALFWLADRVEESLQIFRDQYSPSKTWETKERILVALAGVAENELLIRRAARLAMRTRGSLIGVHIISQDGLGASNTSLLDQQRDLLQSLGGTFIEITAKSIVDGIMQIAKAENATQIVLGASRRSQLQRIIGGNVIDDIVDASGHGIDVHVVSVAKREAKRRQRLARLIGKINETTSNRRRAFSLVAMAIIFPIVTILLAELRRSLALSAVTLIFLLLVTAVGLVGGLMVSIIGALSGFLLLNYYFAPPLHTFTISNSRDLITLVAFLGLSSAFGLLIDIQRRRLILSKQNEIRSRLYGRAAEILVTSSNPTLDLLGELRKQLRKNFALITKGPIGSGEEIAFDGSRESADAENQLQIDLANGSHHLYVGGGALEPFDIEVLAVFRPQIEAALTAKELAEERERSELLRQGDAFRKSLLAAVSHDLRTPLATIRAAASGLLADDIDLGPELEKELKVTIDDEASNLTEIVSNLLDLTRLNMGGVSVKLEDLSPAAFIDQTLLSLRRSLPRIVNKTPESIDNISADQALLERALVNVIENALAYSPIDSKVEINAISAETSVAIEVRDEGNGISEEDLVRIFEPFQRVGDSQIRPGIGLGLAVAKGFVEAQGGHIEVKSKENIGTEVRIVMRRSL
ncbi:MAG: ATP-binding protein [Actinomycetota bacterium]|nr:ATP-binding protein [Actinomycetota bacterium]